jgi:tRNA(adenine34) deaminase
MWIVGLPAFERNRNIAGVKLRTINMNLKSAGFQFLRRAIDLALAAERSGNLPIGTVITLDDKVIAEAGNAMVAPFFHRGRHAETEALSKVPSNLWLRAKNLTCYTTLEPCTMCYGTMLLMGIGRIVFGASDPQGGASFLLSHLPPYYEVGRNTPEWIGPVLPEECDPLFERAKVVFDRLVDKNAG